jgi:hypothetical protein
MTKFRNSLSVPKILLHRVEIELQVADEFYKHTAQSFTARIRQIEDSCAKRSEEELNRDLGGTTMGELAGEQIQESEMLSQMNGYFGVLNVFGVLEQFLQGVFEDMKRRGKVTGRTANRDSLKFDEYRDELKGKWGVSIPEDKWKGLKKLQLLRNVIAHRSGHVLGEQVKKFAGYRYKVDGKAVKYAAGSTIVVDEECFYYAIAVVRDACSSLSQKLHSRQRARPKRNASTSP